MAINQANLATFESHLIDAYEDLFVNDPEYAYAALITNPAKLACKIAAELAAGAEMNKGGKGVKRACKALGIKHTYKAIQEYLNAPRGDCAGQ